MLSLVRYLALGLKWLLVALGAYGLIGLFLQRMSLEYWRSLWP